MAWKEGAGRGRQQLRIVVLCCRGWGLGVPPPAPPNFASTPRLRSGALVLYSLSLSLCFSAVALPFLPCSSLPGTLAYPPSPLPRASPSDPRRRFLRLPGCSSCPRMASQGAANNRRPPLAPPPKRSADNLSPDVLTYKRRRRVTTAAPDQNQMSMAAAHGTNSRQDMPARHWTSWRDTLEGFLHSSSLRQQGSGGEGIQICILDALRYNGCQSAQQGNNLPQRPGAGRELPTVKDAAFVKFEDGTAASSEANRAMCHNALFDVLVSEKFAMLCDLLTATFHANKPGEVIGLDKIDSKMRNGDYAHNPALLHYDIKQIWEKFEQVGREMADLASNLSVISRGSYQKQVSGVSEIDVTEHKVEETSLVGVARKVLRESTPPCDSGHSTIPKRTGASRPNGVCKDCGKKADSEGRIICDRCEAAYHVSCVKLAIEDDPVKWYCSTCTELDVSIKNSNNGRSHEDCNVCDWLEVTKPVEHPEDISRTELVVKTQESSVSSMGEDSEPDLSTTALSNLCKHCGTCEDEDKKFLVCGHPYCSYKYYHILCLKESQIAIAKQKSQACWYCPSCLCRGCFKDEDDDNTVLCDGCDDAYHLYCMNPPRACVPKGQWYCTQCSVRRSVDGLQKYERSILQSVSGAKRSKALVGGAPENK